MTKKSLGDLLRQEAQDMTIDVEPIQEVTADVLEQDAEAGDDLPMHKTDKTLAKRTNPTKADLEATVVELTEALEQASQKEGSLEQQIADLQSQLDEQKLFAQKLQKELEQANLHKTEFEQLKNTALQLAQGNTQLIEEINHLKKKNKEESHPRKNTEDTKVQIYKKSEVRFEDFPEDQPNNSTDFAANTWLL